MNTAYEVNMATDYSCRRACRDKKMSNKDISLFIQRIKDDYLVHFLADNLPSVTNLVHPDLKTVQYEHGFRLGYMKDENFYVNNHLRFIIKYNTDDNEIFHVVGFAIEPHSIAYSEKNFCRNGRLEYTESQMLSKDRQLIAFTYDVHWVKSTIRWESRWDTYITVEDTRIHWFNIIKIVFIIFFLSSILAMIIVRTLCKDIAKYNRDDNCEERLEEMGWKLLHADVFRPPPCSLLLSALVGSGLQLFYMLFFILFLAMLGILSPASRGAFMNAGLFTYIFMGLFSGYFGGKLYKSLQGQQWRSAALLVRKSVEFTDKIIIIETFRQPYYFHRLYSA